MNLDKIFEDWDEEEEYEFEPFKRNDLVILKDNHYKFYPELQRFENFQTPTVYKVQSCQTGSFSRGIRVTHVEQRYGGEYVMRLKGFKGWICFDGWVKESTSIRKPPWEY